MPNKQKKKFEAFSYIYYECRFPKKVVSIEKDFGTLDTKNKISLCSRLPINRGLRELILKTSEM